MAVISVRDLVKTYTVGEVVVRALRGANMDVEAGEFVAVTGPSGSGKSTLMHCVAGLDSLTSGQAFIGDTCLGDLSDNELTLLRREHVGFVFQAFNLIPTISARENIVLPLRLGGKTPDPDWFQAVVDTVGLGDRLTHRPSELSGGQQQRVAVARALVSRPEVVFADEPTGNLDSRSGTEVLGFMRRSVDEFGQSIVMVTHDPIAASHAHSVVFLADGHLVTSLSDPTPSSILELMATMGA
jgi:putative ABC transport system ATP-binding protein